MWADPSIIDTRLDSRAATFENPTGDRGGGGHAAAGRKGAPSKRLEPGERVTLAQVSGPGTIRHVWMTFPPAPPDVMRAVWMEVFYDGEPEPSVSVPCLDFFGLTHGRPVPYASALTAAHEGRGFNAWFPMPFRHEATVELTNGSPRAIDLYYQIDYTLEPDLPDGAGYLHATFRRENPTTMKRDFTIAADLPGPGRFLGACVGVRTIDGGVWYGEGEVKVFRDGDATHPTICGTGLEDYVGSAWGMGPHHAPYAGAPLEVKRDGEFMPEFIGFYRWHVPDPIVFTDECRVTIQQIGMHVFLDGQDALLADYERTNPPAGSGWMRQPRPGVLAMGIAERVDDYCATAFTYCAEPYAVPRLDLASALADIGRRDYETPDPTEAMFE